MDKGKGTTAFCTACRYKGRFLINELLKPEKERSAVVPAIAACLKKYHGMTTTAYPASRENIFLTYRFLSNPGNREIYKILNKGSAMAFSLVKRLSPKKRK